MVKRRAIKPKPVKILGCGGSNILPLETVDTGPGTSEDFADAAAEFVAQPRPHNEMPLYRRSAEMEKVSAQHTALQKDVVKLGQSMGQLSEEVKTGFSKMQRSLEAGFTGLTEILQRGFQQISHQGRVSALIYPKSSNKPPGAYPFNPSKMG